jgi:hypothetical protein
MTPWPLPTELRQPEYGTAGLPLHADRLGPAVPRIDNLKMGIVERAGPKGRVHPAYRGQARCAGFHVDACLPGCPEDKGRVGAVRPRLRGPGRGWRRCRPTATSNRTTGIGGGT